ncbi:Lipid phosphate phosphatase epsilon 1, chloroplastic [Capsicum baccatum]|uniref:Lipid phosphate phosphatase epsilon 1, chloroplastic n=1 Tax=Capsicum baccatum TaxID=33114 RepID=A0A2G2XGY2_CAPBA|nr:Lipid phosphate phosphatase epsilon 1, chloroplastic [Capsicum baccatum]
MTAATTLVYQFPRLNRFSTCKLDVSSKFMSKNSISHVTLISPVMMASIGNRAAGRDESVSIEGLEQEALVDGSMDFSSAGLEATLNSLASQPNHFATERSLHLPEELLDWNGTTICKLVNEFLANYGKEPMYSVKVESQLIERSKLSKWLMAAVFGIILLWRHDMEALWATSGGVLNACLSIALKRILNHERPVSTLRSDPGMPSSHAQSIFYTVAFCIISMVKYIGFNGITAVTGVLIFAMGSYFSWLRVLQQLHTLNQVIVGAVLGFCFSIFWFWLWDAIVLNRGGASLL